MRFTQLLPLVAASTAFVIPDEQVLSSDAVVNKVHHKEPLTKTLFEKVSGLHGLIGSAKSSLKKAQNAFDIAVEEGEEFFDLRHKSSTNVGFDADAWLEDADFESDTIDAWNEDDHPPHHGPPHHGPPHHGPPHHGVCSGTSDVVQASC